jgi:hypothetical protein
MLNQGSDLSQRQVALVAGFALLLMAVLAPVGLFAIIENVLVPGDGAATTRQLAESENVFRIGIGCLLLNGVLDLVAAWALYILLKPVSKSFSLLAAWFRIAYTVMLVVALGHLLGSLKPVGGADYLAALAPPQLHAQVMMSVNAFRDVWDISYVLFGLHLGVLGYVVFKSGFLPKFVGALVCLAGLGYLVDAFGLVLFHGYSLNIAIYTFVGEAFLFVWLLIRGFKGFDIKKASHG